MIHVTKDFTLTFSSNYLRDEINKRLTLNLLIQGAATHTFMTSHHLVKSDLEAINPKLIGLYDKITVGSFLGYWIGDLVLFTGRPGRFWTTTHRPDHPFHLHRFLARHGRGLADTAKRMAVDRAKQKGMSTFPGVHYGHVIGTLIRIMQAERGHLPQLQQIARQTTHSIWGIDIDRLDGTLTTHVEFGNLMKPTTLSGKVLRQSAVGYGGVVRVGDQFHVVAKAWIWPLLSHELVKGTAELVCLHGLNRMEDEVYEQVIAAADKIEYEIWLMQAGSTLWRKLLKVLPPGSELPFVLMQMAMLAPHKLEELMFEIVESPHLATSSIRRLVG